MGISKQTVIAMIAAAGLSVSGAALADKPEKESKSKADDKRSSIANALQNDDQGRSVKEIQKDREKGEKLYIALGVQKPGRSPN